MAHWCVRLKDKVAKLKICWMDTPTKQLACPKTTNRSPYRWYSRETTTGMSSSRAYVGISLGTRGIILVSIRDVSIFADLKITVITPSMDCMQSRSIMGHQSQNMASDLAEKMDAFSLRSCENDETSRRRLLSSARELCHRLENPTESAMRMIWHEVSF